MQSAKYPQAPSYTPAPSYIAPAPPQVPSVIGGKGIMKQTAQMESMLPGWLQLSQTNPLDPAGREKYESDFYSTYINPTLAKAQADAGANGQTYGSFSGAKIGQIAAEGQLAKAQAGLNYAQQYYDNQLQGRQSYYGNAPSIIQNQNALDVQRGLGISQLNQNAANMQNSYNLNANNGLNNFAMSNYGNQLARIDRINADQQNRWNAITGGITGLIGGIQ